MSLHFNLLNQAQKEVLEKLKVFRREAMLAGGTALELQLGHRYSFDFDLFFSRKLNRRDILKLKRVLKIKEVELERPEQINLIAKKNILINLVFYPFKPLFKPIKTTALPLLCAKDIALDKAYAIGRRATWRDYVDLFFLLKSKRITLAQVLRLAKKKFGIEFNEKLFLEQLCYFKDIEITKISFIKKTSEKEIKNFLVNEVKRISKKLFFR